mgnify:CR=1 FL=1
MLKPIRWKTFPLDFLRIQIGFALYGISIVLMIKSNLGTGAWAVLDVALSNIIGLSVGRMTMLSGFVVLTIALAMREQVGWGTLGNMLFIGLWLDFVNPFVPSAEGNLLIQVAMLLGAVLLMGLDYWWDTARYALIVCILTLSMGLYTHCHTHGIQLFSDVIKLGCGMLHE